jgi:fructokinase
MTERSVLSLGYVPLDIVKYKRSYWHAAGGTAGNVAAILGFLGWTSHVAAEIGDDLAGGRLRKDLQRSNVSVEFLRVNRGVSTPRLVHSIGTDGHRYTFTCPSCGLHFPMSRPLRLDLAAKILEKIEKPDIVFIDRINSATLLLVESYKRRGSRIVYEPSRPSNPRHLSRILEAADLVKCADDRDIGFDPDEVKIRGQIQIVTSGSKGAKYRVCGGAWHFSAAFQFPVIDAGGAGDWTTSGLVHALPSVGRWSLGAVGDALRWGQALAAASCGAPGARGLSRQQSVESVLRTVQFVQQAKSGDSIATASGWSASSVPRSACSVCLMPSIGEATGHDEFSAAN